MGYPGFHDTVNQEPQSPATPEDAETMLRDAMEAEEKARDGFVILETMKVANDIPGVEYESFEDFLEHAEMLFEIVKAGSFEIVLKDSKELDKE